MSKATPFNGLRNTVAALMRLMDGKADKDKVVSSVNGQTGDVTVDMPAELPAVTAADAGKFLRVSADGAWAAEEATTEEWTFTLEDDSTVTKKVVVAE